MSYLCLVLSIHVLEFALIINIKKTRIQFKSCKISKSHSCEFSLFFVKKKFAVEQRNLLKDKIKNQLIKLKPCR